MSEFGLPELPEGFFWRVEHPPSRETHMLIGGGYFIDPYRNVLTPRDEEKLRVCLMRRYEGEEKEIVSFGWFRKPQWQSKTVTREETVMARDCQGTAPVAVLNAANWILKRWEERERVAGLVGDYPPKRLELS